MSGGRLDPRLHAYRPDLADERLRGRVEAARFAPGERKRVVAPTAPIRAEPYPDAPLLSEALAGEDVRVFDETAEGWAWGQLETDGYVGWFPADALGTARAEPTHCVTALRTFLYPGPDLKLPPLAALSIGSRLVLGEEVVTRGTTYRRVIGVGAVAARHVSPLGAEPAGDFVAVAERFLGTPYLWGGRSSLGLDCSGLVQLSLMMAGRAAPRDSDQQEASLGTPLAGGVEAPLGRGDLIFWRGHVGIMSDAKTLLHANAFHMEVAAEPLAAALERIAAAGSRPTSVRRLS